jgi:TM2 domain-containing membrane protein YozV
MSDTPKSLLAAPVALAPAVQTGKSKTLATWLALVGGPLGLHRFYLHGPGDPWGWLHPWPTLLGLWGLWRADTYGLDDRLSWLLLPLLGGMIAVAMLQAIVCGLTPDARWHARFNPQWVDAQGEPVPDAPASGWLTVIGVALALMLGATALMSAIAFASQRYFEAVGTPEDDAPTSGQARNMK